ncbi:hypothetical protein N8653_02940 [Euryarchaeota archaeon]|nr:hypothetical protein [Euryarchaeota archaeon]
MFLLYQIFPTLKNHNFECGIPEWNDKNNPWSILSTKVNDSIIQQIKNLKLEYPARNDSNKLTLDESKGPIYIHPSAKIGDYALIEGPCYIGKGAEIRHSAFLRAGSWICENAIVGHSSEIKNSVLLPGSKAPHFNYVGDSIIGFDVNLGAGAKISNVRNDRRNILVNLENGKKINTELRKFGSLIGDGSEIGCNVVSNPGTILEPKTMINPNITIKGWVKN